MHHHASVAVVVMVRHKAVSPRDCSWRRDGIYLFSVHGRGYIFGGTTYLGENITEIHKCLCFGFGEIVLGLLCHYITTLVDMGNMNMFKVQCHKETMLLPP